MSYNSLDQLFEKMISCSTMLLDSSKKDTTKDSNWHSNHFYAVPDELARKTSAELIAKPLVRICEEHLDGGYLIYKERWFNKKVWAIVRNGRLQIYNSKIDSVISEEIELKTSKISYCHGELTIEDVNGFQRKFQANDWRWLDYLDNSDEFEERIQCSKKTPENHGTGEIKSI
eukprot:TRINITY_DN6635_c0_g1_i1.p1 TRINITY_DN6635_c0_g1~~TRINITY_DN6635_c0_g1_i1.p1  ORF type:complete len:191 (-),score=39.20 TRINITY_DN6635_c0_g1_i1:58-576(-)